MSGFEEALALLLLTAGLSIVARWLPWPKPITYVVGGVIFGHVSFFPRVVLDPGFFFICFLPPLLFADGWLMPLREFNRAKRPILLLSTGLVVLTTLAVGFTAHALIHGLPLSMALALGAVLSPTDAVAVSSIMDRMKVPSRLKTVLAGESLMNDATGLVAFKYALGAALAGTFSLHDALFDFVLLAIGGLLIGLGVAYGVGKLRDGLIRLHSTDPLIEITLSLLTPYVAYVVAEVCQVSSILAVVAAGLYSGWRDPIRMDAESRQTSWGFWSVVLFWLNGLAFVLLGLQFPHLYNAVLGQYALPQLVLAIVILSAVAVIVRLAWFFPAALLPFVLSQRVRQTETRPSWQAILVGAWGGMRGTVTLAAALSIPLLLPNGKPFPGRDIVIFLAFGVIATSLLTQATTAEWLIKRLGLHEDAFIAQEDRLARITAVDAGLKTLRAIDMSAATPEDAGALAQIVAEYELRLSALVADGHTGSQARHRRQAQNRYLMKALEAERHAIDDLWRRNVINDEIHRPLQAILDHEESMLRAPASHEAEG